MNCVRGVHWRNCRSASVWRVPSQALNPQTSASTCRSKAIPHPQWIPGVRGAAVVGNVRMRCASRIRQVTCCMAFVFSCRHTLDPGFDPLARHQCSKITARESAGDCAYGMTMTHCIRGQTGCASSGDELTVQR